MTDMERELARAICKAEDMGDVELIFAATVHSGDCTNEAFTCQLCLQDECLKLAVGIIAALAEAGLVIVLREPSEAMLDATCEIGCHRGSSEDAWQAMIQAMIAVHPEEPADD